MSWLKELYAQQTTPDEVIIFLLLGTFITLVISFLAYAIVLIALSRWRTNTPYSMWSLLFPSGQRIRNYAAEYLLGIVTALLLAFTVSAKYGAVEAVLAQDINDIGRDAVRSALPLGRLETEELVTAGANPENAERLVSWLDEGVATPLSGSVNELVRPLLAAGMSESANLIVREAVKALNPGSNSMVGQDVILAVAISLLMAYVAWFSVQRWQEMQKERVRDPSYATIIKRLSLPAVCIPLLLVSAVAMDNPERLENSVIGYAGVSDPPPETSLAKVIGEQAADVRNGALTVRAEDLEQVNETLAALDQRVAAAAQRLSSHGDSLRDMERRLQRATSSISNVTKQTEELNSTVSELREDLYSVERKARADAATAAAAATRAVDMHRRLQGGISTLEKRLTNLQRLVDSLNEQLSKPASQTGMLLVISYLGNGDFQVRRGAANGPIVRSGSDVGLYALPPGRYWVASGNQRRQATLQSDNAAAVYFPYVNVIQ